MGLFERYLLTAMRLAELQVLFAHNQSSVSRAFLDFEEAGHMKSLDFFASVVDLMKELIKLTLPTEWSDQRFMFSTTLFR